MFSLKKEPGAYVFGASSVRHGSCVGDIVVGRHAVHSPFRPLAQCEEMLQLEKHPATYLDS